jgi:hypothetical protein
VSMLAAVAIVACETDVPGQDMEAMAAWSTAICACAKKSRREAKACAAALKEPAPLDMTTRIGRPRYRPDGAGTYSGLKYQGEMCEQEADNVER